MSIPIKKTKAIVTGGAGFIGSHLVDALIAEGYEVHVIDNLINGKKELINPKAKFYHVDIGSVHDVTNAFGLVGTGAYVFHLACLPRVSFSIEYPRKTHDANVNGTFNVLMAAREFNAKRVIYSASSSAYGDQLTLPLVETMKPMPKSQKSALMPGE